MIVVQSLFPKPFVGFRNTDNSYLADLARLSERYPMILRHLDHVPSLAVANMSYAANSLARRLPGGRSLTCSPRWVSLRRLVPLSKRYLKRAGADLIYTNGFFPLLKTNIPIVLEADFFDYKDTNGNSLASSLYVPPWILERAVSIIVRHEHSLNALKDLHPTAGHKARMIPHYMPYLESIDESALLKKFAGTTKIAAAFVGHQAIRKGLPNIVTAMSLMRKEMRSLFELTVVSEFRDGAVRLPSDVTVIRNATRQKAAAIMRRSHLLVLPSLSEAACKVFVEAMASGCALICANREPQLSLYAKFGAAVDPLQPDELAVSMEKFITDRQRTLALARLALSSFNKVFNPVIVGAQYFSVFTQALRCR